MPGVRGILDSRQGSDARRFALRPRRILPWHPEREAAGDCKAVCRWDWTPSYPCFESVADPWPACCSCQEMISEVPSNDERKTRARTVLSGTAEEMSKRAGVFTAERGCGYTARLNCALDLVGLEALATPVAEGANGGVAVSTLWTWGVHS